MLFPVRIHGAECTLGIALALLLATAGCSDHEHKSQDPPPYSDRVPSVRRMIALNDLTLKRTSSGAGLWFEPYEVGSVVSFSGFGVCYDFGLVVGAKIGGVTFVSTSSMFTGDFRAERTESGETEVHFLTPFDTPSIPDYVQWPVAAGAPHTPDGQPRAYGVGTIFTAFNDEDPLSHRRLHGAPMGAFVQETVWAQSRFPSVLFVRWEVTNRSTSRWEDAYLGVWSDPDLGAAHNDRIGSDVARNMNYAYTDTASAEEYFGSTNPSFGIRYLKTTNDAGLHAAPRPLKSSGEPTSPQEAYNYLLGLDMQGHPMIDPTTNLPTLFWAAGDPIAGTGHVDALDFDRQMMGSVGPFSLGPGESTQLVVALILTTNEDAMVSLALLRTVADQVAVHRELWDLN